jgi:alpha-D-xyloside xylohydrolase
VPWSFDEEAVDVLRRFTRLKCRLMPYLWDAAAVASESGVPLLRAMLLEFPDDPACRWLDAQYTLGDALLVAPVFREDGEVDVYLPPGRWTHLLSGEVVEGGGYRRERHGYLSLPLYVRPGALLALGAVEDRPDYDHADGVELHLFELADGATARATVRDARGSPALQASVRRVGSQLTASFGGNSRGLTLVLRGQQGVAAQSGAGEATLRQAEDGVRVEVAAGVERIVLTLR